MREAFRRLRTEASGCLALTIAHRAEVIAPLFQANWLSKNFPQSSALRWAYSSAGIDQVRQGSAHPESMHLIGGPELIICPNERLMLGIC